MKPFEKRKYPRVDTSKEDFCRITVFGLTGRPLEGQILNLSLGGVAFTSHWRNIAMAAKKLATKVRIQLPNWRLCGGEYGSTQSKTPTR
jgi:hypothetical protein